MFKKLRNRFLLLLMTTVTVLLAMFFFAVVAFYNENANRRNMEILDRGFNIHESSNPKEGLENTDRFSPVFSVDLKESGQIDSIHSTFNMDSLFYDGLVSIVKKEDKGSGSIFYNKMTFMYKTFSLDIGQRIVFLDVSRDVQVAANMIYFFIWSSLPLLLLIFLISKYFADKAIEPIKDSFDRQNQFIADASHELKTPLATINANASVLLDSATDEQRKWLSFIKDETIRIEKLTSGLLYLSREPVAKSERERCNLSQIINGVLMPLEAVLFEKQIDLSNEVENDVFVQASEEQLRRLIGIFVENAVKYTENKLSVKLQKQAKNAVITLSNNGIGISSEDLDKIWDRFYRTDKARKHKGGFGLGLAMAKSIVAELGGNVKVSSVPNELTTFTIILPAA